MDDSVRRALNAYKYKKQQNNKYTTDKDVLSALELYEKKRNYTAEEKIKSIQERLEQEINNYNSYIDSPISHGYGDSAAKDTLEAQRQSRINISDLRKELESYRDFLGDGYDEAISSLDSLSKGYDSVLDYAQSFSQWKTEDEYKESVQAQKNREELLGLNLEAEKKGIDYLENQYKGIVNSQKEINRLKGELDTYKLAKSKGGNVSKKIEEIENAIASHQKAIDDFLKGDTVQDFQAYLDSRKSKYSTAQRLQTETLLDDVGNSESNVYDPNFNKYVEVGNSLDFSEVGSQKRYSKLGKGRGSVTSIDSERAAALALYEHNGGTIPSKYDHNKDVIDTYRNFSDDEFKTLAYWMGYDEANGTNKTEEYLKAKEDTLNIRAGQGIFEKVADYVALELAFGVVAGLDQFSSGLENLFNTKDDYIAPSAIQYASGMVREDLAGDEDSFKIFGNSLGQIGYDFITTTTNMVPSMATSALVGTVSKTAGAALGASLLGASAAGNAYQDMLNAGYDKSQARTYSTLVGISEAGLQYALGGVSKLGSGAVGEFTSNTLGKIAKGINRASIQFAVENGGKFVGNMIGEGFEEWLQDVLDPFFRSIATGEKPEGVDWEQAAYSGMLGALSAGFLEGIRERRISKAETKTARSIKNEGNVETLKKVGMTFSADSVAYKIADKITDKTGAYKLSMLLHDVNANLSEQNRQDIEKALMGRGIAEADAKTISKWLGKAVDGGNLNKNQQKALDDNPIISDVFRDVIVDKNSTVNQRLQGMMDLYGKEGSAGVDLTAVKESVPTNEQLSQKINATTFLKQMAEESVRQQYGLKPTTSRETNAMLDSMVNDAVKIAEKNKPETIEEKIKNGKVKVSKENGVSVNKITSIGKDGTIKVETSNGTVENVNDITYKSNDDAYIILSTADLSTKLNGLGIELDANSANAVINGYTPTRNTFPHSGTSYSIDAYMMGAEEAIRYGAIGQKIDTIKKDSAFHKLTKTQQEYLYKIGKDIANKSPNKVDSGKTSATPNKSKKGKVTKAIKSKLKPSQETAISTIEKLSETGILKNNFYIFESTDGTIVRNGKKMRARVFSEDVGIYKIGDNAPNGIYRAENGDIYIDLYAGNSAQGIALYTLGHELGHFVKEQNAEGFGVLAEFVANELGGNLEGLIQQKLALWKELGRTEFDYMDAFEDVVCDALEPMFTDGKLAQKLVEHSKSTIEGKGLLKTLKEFFTNLYKRIQKAYAELTPDDPAARIMKQNQESVEKLADLFAKAIVDANNNFETAEATLEENGIEVDPSTNSAKLSVRYLLEDTQKQKVVKSLVDRFGVTEKEASNWLTAETSLSSLILNPQYSQYLDYEADPDEVAIKTNSDYPQGTVDFSPICAKRREFTSVMNNVLRLFPNHVFAATDLAKIRTIMQEEGMTIPCGICYVEDRRQLDTIVAQDFIDGLKLYREGSKTRPDGKPFNANQLKGLQLTDGDTYIPSVYELVSLEGRNKLKAKNPNMEAAWVKYNNARGMQAVRLLANEAEYKRQILDYSKSTVKAKNDKGGLRIYSFSDAEMFHLIDIIQVITDSATVGLYLQGYTKVNEYAKAVKDTGEKLNRSLIPKGELGYHMENGKVVLDYDTVEGIDINSKDFFDNRDNPDVGNITIGVSDVQIRAAMLSDFVDQIIPFHTGQSAEVLGEKGIATWTNYKDFQAEKDIATGKKSEHQINIYTEVLQVLEKEGTPITKRSFVEKFLQVCKENELTPRFSQFLNTNENGEYIYTEGYHKMLVDFKTFAQTEVGEYLPQKAVKPIFDNEYITNLLKDYVVSQKVKDAAIAESMPKVIERITNEIINPSEQGKSTSAAKYSDRNYSYNALVNKPDMTLTVIGGKVPSNRADVVAQAKKNATKVGKFNTKDGSISVHVNDIDSDVIMSTAGLRHSLDRRLEVNAPVVLKAGEILQNSIRINELTPQKAEASESYVLIGAAKSLDGQLYVVRSVVNKFKNELVSMDVLYAINAKTEPIADNKKRNQPGDNPQDSQFNNHYLSDSTISISNLLDYVNKYFPDILPEDVLKHYGHDSRPKGKLGKDALFSDRNIQPITDTEYQAIEKHFGTTGNFKVAGYLLTDGKLLDFSGKHWGDTTSRMRQVDHREINEVLGRGNNGINDMIDMIGNGNIRLMPEIGGINLAVYPNEKQRRVLSQYINYMLNTEGNVIIDYDFVGGDTVYSKIYGKTATSKQILNDIRNYFNGAKQSELMSFHTMGDEVKYSDRAYLDAVNRGDMETAQRMVEEAAKKAGYTQKLYHGTRQFGFTKFEGTEGYSYDEIQFFTTDSLETAGSYSETADVRRIADKGNTEQQTKIRGLANELSSLLSSEIGKDNYTDSESLIEAARKGDMNSPKFVIDWLRDVYVNRYSNEKKFGFKKYKSFKDFKSSEKGIELRRKASPYIGRLSELVQGESSGIYEFVANTDNLFVLDGNGTDWNNLTDSRLPESRKYNTRDVCLWAKEQGYSGVLFKNIKDSGSGQDVSPANVYAFFDPRRQVKSADPVTYDDNGNVIPLSKRFNESNDDIRFSDRDYRLNNRNLLANALESTAKNEVEREWLKKYKENIASLNADQKRLDEINAEIKAISFTKGSDRSKLTELNNNKKTLTARINRADKKLLEIEAAKPLKKVLEVEKQRAIEKIKAQAREDIKAEKETSAKNVRELMDRYTERIKRNKEGRDKTELRHKIIKVVKDLNNLLLKPTKERHIPEEMRMAVAEALNVVNMDTVSAEERLAEISEKLRKETDPIKFNDLLASYRRIQEQGDKISEKLTKLKEAYGLIRDSADDSLKSLYDDVIYSKIETVQQKVGNTPIRNMTREQLESVHDLYTMVLTSVRDSNKAFAEDLKMTRQELGSNVFGEIKDHTKARDRIKHPFVEKFGWKNLKPMQAMKTIGSSILQKLWNNVLYGQEVFAQDYDEAVKFAKEMKEKHGYDKWDLNKLYSFESKSGKAMKINLEQMMSIYAYSKRKQADEHIEYGGIVLNEGVIKEKNKLGKVVEVQVNDSTAYRLNKLQVGEIIATLEEEFPGAKDFVDEMQKYLSETMGEKGNEVSMKMYGIKLFKEEHYFPLKSSKDFMEAANAKLKGDVKIKNKGMTKATVEHAQNPIVLEGFLDVWGNHVNEMAMYHGLVLPLEDFSRTLNYSFKANDELNTDAESVRTALHDAFGDYADNYLNELLKAINGGVLHDSSAEFADKMISKFKKAKVMASLSVIIQQPTAIIRAMGIIEPKYFSSQNFRHKQTWEELKKYCPTAIIKETGSFDTNMGRTIVDMVKDEQGLTDKVGDFLGKAPAYMDEMGWNMIWRALKNKVATEQNLSGETLLKECGKQMTLILNETQVYDSVMARSEMMRSKNALTKMATAFMAEPTTVANMIYGAVLDFTRGKKDIATKTVAATIGSVVINGLVSSMVYALRDDDDDETALEKYASSATTEVLDGLNPLTYIPFIKDIYSLFQGYKVERTDMALVGDVVDAINKFYKVFDYEKYEDMGSEEVAKHLYDNIKPLLSSICDLFGLPVGNVLRDTEAIIESTILAFSSETASKGMGAAFKEGALNSLPQILRKIIEDMGEDSK